MKHVKVLPTKLKMAEMISPSPPDAGPPISYQLESQPQARMQCYHNSSLIIFLPSPLLAQWLHHPHPPPHSHTNWTLLIIFNSCLSSPPWILPIFPYPVSTVTVCLALTIPPSCCLGLCSPALQRPTAGAVVKHVRVFCDDPEGWM